MLAGRRRPLWLVAALAVLSLGAYVPIWFGLTWVELRRETKDETMQPLWHALLVLVPGVNITLVWRHFKAINTQLDRVPGIAQLDPLTGGIGIAIWWLTWTHDASEPVLLVLNAVEIIAGAGVVVYGQRALNALWAGRGAEEKVLETDLIALAVALTYGLFSLVGLFVSPS